MRYLVVGLGGVLGALTRYGVSLLLNERWVYPWGTLAVNLTGCFLLALFLTLVLKKYSKNSYVVLAVATGFIGSLTTFSAISVEGILLFKRSLLSGFVYLVLTMAGGYLLTWAGYASGRFFLNTTGFIGGDKNN